MHWITDVQPIPVNIQLLNKKINKKDFENEFEDFWNRYQTNLINLRLIKILLRPLSSYGAEIGAAST